MARRVTDWRSWYLRDRASFKQKYPTNNALGEKRNLKSLCGRRDPAKGISVRKAKAMMSAANAPFI
jgi:hypothetical protein